MLLPVWFMLAAECTFEYFLGSSSATCGWTHDASANFQWTRATGSTTSYGTGPSFDHTYGTSKGTQDPYNSTSPLL